MSWLARTHVDGRRRRDDRHDESVALLGGRVLPRRRRRGDIRRVRQPGYRQKYEKLKYVVITRGTLIQGL